MRLVQTSKTLVRTIVCSRPTVLLVAAVAIGSIFFQWSPADPRIYPGLDPKLIFVNLKGSGQQGGSVQITGNDAVITAVGDSSPRVDLVDSESAFSSDFDVIPAAAGQTWEPASVTVTPPKGARYFEVLVGVVGGTVLFSDLTITSQPAAGQAGGRTVFHDDFSDPKLSKWFRPSGVDRTATGVENRFAMRITSPGSNETGTHTAVLGFDEAQSYVVSTHIRNVAGLPNFKIAVAWIDSQRRVLGYVPDWGEWSRFAPQIFVPATVSLWYPARGNAINLEFSADARSRIRVITVENNRLLHSTDLGDYMSGLSYHVSLRWQPAQSASIRITTPNGTELVYAIDRGSGFGLFEDPFVNFSVEASAPPGVSSSVILRNVRLIVPSTTRFAINVSDWRLTWLTWAVIGWLIAYLLIQSLTRAMAFRLPGAKFRRVIDRLTTWRALAITAAAVVTCSVYVAAAQFDGHPFDRLSQESAAYVIQQYGVGAVYGRTSTIPDEAIRGGFAPWAPVEFAYPAGMVNFFIAVAGLWDWFRGAIAPLHDRAFYAFWKLCFSVFVLVDVALLVAIARKTFAASTRRAWLLAAAFVLNPALIFDTPVWGQSNAFLLAPLLMAVFALLINGSRLMWTMIVVAVSIKQTALLFVPLLAVFATRRFGLVRTAVDAAFALVVGFVFIAPATLAGVHPDTSIVTTVGKLVDFGTPLTNYTTQVSADTFNMWVLFTGFGGLRGHDRLWASDHTAIGFLNLTYAEAGLALFLVVGAMATLVAWRAARGEHPSYERLFLAIALVIVAWVTLSTRTSGHYLILALPFLLLTIPPASAMTAMWKVAAVSASALLSEYGLFMFIAQKGEWPTFVGLGSPSTNVISSWIYRLYTSDVVITLFAAMMLYVLGHLLAEVATPKGDIRLLVAPASPETVREATGNS